MSDTRTRTVKLPSLTTELETAELLEWLVAEGDQVREGDPLAEVTTDKVEMELPSPYTGTVTELLQETGAVLELGAEMVRIETSSAESFDLGLDDEPADEATDETAEAPVEEAAAAASAEQAAEADAATDEQTADAPSDAPASTNGAARVPAPPGVRARAEELAVDLSTVTPTGSRGQVTLDDLEQARTRTDAPAPTSTPAPPSAPPRSRPAAPAPAALSEKDARRRAAVRAATARSTTRSQAIPQFTLFRRADVTERNARRDGVSWTTLVAQALAAALWRHPGLNATWDEETGTVVRREDVRIGLAVDTPTGLLVATLDDPDRLNPHEADAVVRDAAERTREGKLRPEEMQGASSTVSNLGGFGVERFTALLLPPQATILSVGTIAKQPVVVDDEVVPRLCVELGLTVDHRVADGADGARFLSTLIEFLEQR